MKIIIEMKDDKIFWDMEIGEDTEQGNTKINTDNYFMLAAIVSRFKEYRNAQVKDFRDSIMNKFIKEELSKRSKQEQSNDA